MNTESAFQSLRPRLMALAYRLLGSRSDAEDVVQDAWLRWSGADPAAVRDPEAWLVTTTTRLGLDRLRAARRERVHYVGPWLAEPLEISLAAEPASDPAVAHARADEVSVAFLTLLEQLQEELGLTYLFISHDLTTVRRFAHSVWVLKGGKLLESGPTEHLFAQPQSDYTRLLLSAIPDTRSLQKDVA